MNQCIPPSDEVQIEVLAAALEAMGRDRDELAKRIDELDSWDGMMATLNRYYPADVMKRMSDDPGPRITLLIREIDRLKSQQSGAVKVMRTAVATLGGVDRQPLSDACCQKLRDASTSLMAFAAAIS